jgi:uncharacterized protein YjiK
MLGYNVRMAYEMFARTSIRMIEPALTFTPEGRIVLNAASTRIMIEAGIKTVLLLSDKDKNKIALKGASANDKNGYALTVTAKHSSSVRAKSFLSHIGWRPQERHTLAAVWNQGARMLEVSLPSHRDR